MVDDKVSSQCLSTVLFAVLLYRWSCKSDNIENAGVSAADKMRIRTVKTVVLSRWQSEGKGARVRRSIGRPELRSVYLLFDMVSFSIRVKGRDIKFFVDRKAKTIFITVFIYKHISTWSFSTYNCKNNSYL
jgi:hypothetical protein